MSTKEEKELKEMEERLQEVRKVNDEESRLVNAIKRKKQEMQENELQELRKEALPFREEEERLFNELVKQVLELSQKMEELQNVQSEIRSRHTYAKYKVPEILEEGVFYALARFKDYFPEKLGLPRKMSRKEKELEGARQRLAYLEKMARETPKGYSKTGLYSGDISEMAERRVRYARERVERLSQ